MTWDGPGATTTPSKIVKVVMHLTARSMHLQAVLSPDENIYQALFKEIPDIISCRLLFVRAIRPPSPKMKSKQKIDETYFVKKCHYQL